MRRRRLTVVLLQTELEFFLVYCTLENTLAETQAGKKGTKEKHYG